MKSLCRQFAPTALQSSLQREEVGSMVQHVNAQEGKVTSVKFQIGLETGSGECGERSGGTSVKSGSDFFHEDRGARQTTPEIFQMCRASVAFNDKREMGKLQTAFLADRNVTHTKIHGIGTQHTQTDVCIQIFQREMMHVKPRFLARQIERIIVEIHTTHNQRTHTQIQRLGGALVRTFKRIDHELEVRGFVRRRFVEIHVGVKQRKGADDQTLFHQ